MQDAQRIIVHHLENSRSQRVLWLLEELGLAYDVVRYQRDPKTMLAPAELRAVHPLGKSPVVVDGDEVLAESGAIIEALAERHDAGHRLSPVPGSPEMQRYRYWLHYAEGSAMPPLLMRLVFGRIRSAPMPFFAKPIARGIVDTALRTFIGPQLKLHFGYMEAELRETRLVRRRPLHRCRYPDELPAGSRRAAGRLRRLSEPACVPAAHPCATGL